MISSVASTNLHNKDSCSYSSSLEPYIFPPPPYSFDIPFNDPNMEPLPLGPNASKCNGNGMILSSPESLFPETDDYPSSAFNNGYSKPLSLDTTNPRQDRMGILDPLLMDSAGSKRSWDDDLFSDDEPCKRQRTMSHLPAAASDIKSMARLFISASNLATAPAEEHIKRFRPSQEKQWWEQYAKLFQYKLEHGHCCVPHSYAEDPVLARWVKRQRYQYTKMNEHDPTSTMTTRRLQALKAIGFVWHSHASTWQAKWHELRAFKRRTGHCNVPSDYPENTSLSSWVRGQRRQYKLYKTGSSLSTMTVARFRALESLGFAFVTAPSINLIAKPNVRVVHK